MSLSKFDKAFAELDLSARPKRRHAPAHIIDMLGCIRNEEEAYLERIPPNFQSGEAYAAADDSVSCLSDAIDTLADAY